MSDSLTVRATLTGLTIKPGKESGDDPIVTLTLAPDFEDELKALVKRVGQQIDQRPAPGPDLAADGDVWPLDERGERPMTDHEQTALAALVAWRKARLVLRAAARDPDDWREVDAEYRIAERNMDAAADLVIAERAAAVGR